MKQKKEVYWFNFLTAAACLFTGLLAGADVDRYIVQVPAWRHVSIINWSMYSRYADLRNGLFLYPFEAISSFLMLFSVSAIVVSHKSYFKQVAFPVYLATIFAALGLFFTIFAAPVMLGIRTIANNEIILQKAFDKFHFWGLLRAISQILSFFACIWVFTRNSINVRSL
jgi:hypothetical protein